MHFHLHVEEVADEAVDHVPLHGEQADFRVDGKAVGHDAVADFLEVPYHLIEWEGDLLLGLKLDDVANLLFFDRREFHEPRQAGLAGHAHGDVIALHGVPFQELDQRLAGKLIRIGIRLA